MLNHSLFSPSIQSTKTVRNILLLAIACIAMAVLVVTAGPAWAISSAGKAHQQIDWWEMVIQLFGGLAIFLFGMDLMADALKKVAGSRMKNILGKLTGNRVYGMMTGAFVTAIIQSSSVTTVILVGFVTSGLLSLSQAVGIILGANIGTTITAQIVAFKITKYALVFVAAGFAMNFISKSKKVQYYGLLVLGLGLIFFGMGLMSEGMKPLRSYEPFIELMGSVSNPFVGILVAAAFTGLVQSSSATLGVVIALSMQGLVTLEGGIALALGANIGTCVTAALAAIGKPREAIRVAVAHIAFNTLGVLLMIGFIDHFAELIRLISPVSPELSGSAKLAAETPRQIANAHTLFNVAAALVFLPFLVPLARLCEKLVADSPLELGHVIETKYLDEELLATPSLALGRTQLEIGRMGKRVQEMLNKIGPAVIYGSDAELKAIAQIDMDVDEYHSQIVAYLREIGMQDLTEEETDTLVNLLFLAQQMEEVGDIIETSLAGIGASRISENVNISENTAKAILQYHAMVEKAFQLTLDVINDNDHRAFDLLQAMKQELTDNVRDVSHHEMNRLRSGDPNRLKTYTREMEIIDQLTSIFRRCRRIAKSVIEDENNINNREENLLDVDDKVLPVDT